MAIHRNRKASGTANKNDICKQSSFGDQNLSDSSILLIGGLLQGHVSYRCCISFTGSAIPTFF